MITQRPRSPVSVHEFTLYEVIVLLYSSSLFVALIRPQYCYKTAQLESEQRPSVSPSW